MPRLKDVWDGSTGNGYITENEKQDMERMGTPFLITGVSTRAGKFGQQWVLNIEVNEEARLLSLPANPARDRQLEQVREALAEYSEVGPVRLVAYQSSFGKPFYAIEDFGDGSDDS